MQVITMLHNERRIKKLLMLGLVLLAGCAGANQSVERPGDYVEIENPGLTMSPNAPATIWVPRDYVEKGVPRGGELARKGYDAVTGGKPAAPARAAAPVAAAPAATALAVAPSSAAAVPAPPAPVAMHDTAGKPSALLPQFGMVLAVEGDKVYFNLGKDDGIVPGQMLKVFRGGTVVKGLGLAPGEAVGTVEVQGFVGKGGFGVAKRGGPIRTNDLVGGE
jgi:hypothetical protein